MWTKFLLFSGLIILAIKLAESNGLSHDDRVDKSQLDQEFKSSHVLEHGNVRKQHQKRRARPQIGHRQQMSSDKAGGKPPQNMLPHRRRSRVLNIADNWDKIPFIMQTYNEPEEKDYHLMPTLSNGFLGTTVKNNSIYMNGLYTGYGERSHRVRVPSMIAVEAVNLYPFDNQFCSYQFDVRRGVYTIEERSNQALITQRFYAHYRYKNLMVNEIKVELFNRQAVQLSTVNYTNLELSFDWVNTNQNPNNYRWYRLEHNPDNITYENRLVKPPTTISKTFDLNDGLYYMTATVPQTEINNKRQKQIHTYYTNIPSQLLVYANTSVKYFHFLQTVDVDNQRARGTYDDALRQIQQDPTSLYVSHVSAWEETWQKSGFAMITEGQYSDANQESFKMAQRLYVSFYNLYSAIPYSFDNQFYGISPSGLSYSGLRSEFFNSSFQFTSNRQLSEGYGGHLMYYQELWILPLISMFNTEKARTLINTRFRRGFNTDHSSVYETAREAAKQEGFEGVRYPWQQGDYGGDVSPFADARKSKIHVSADISYGLRNFLRTTHSREWLSQAISSEAGVRGEDYIHEIAKYWSDRFMFDPSTNQYEIKGVSFGDRIQTREVNNEAFTNYIGALTMDTYKYALYLLDRNPYETQYVLNTREYDDKLQKTRLPYDSARKLFLEYDNFNTGQQNEETFAPFLNYPLQRHMSYEEKKTLYDSYAIQLPNEGRNIPTYASYVVGYLELNDENKARDYLTRINNHFAGPFQVMTEYPVQGNFINTQNTLNYMPGYAAYIHSFIAGFCGLRVRDFQLDIVYPTELFGSYQNPVTGPGNQNRLFKRPATNVETWNITGFSYRGTKLDFLYDLKSASLTITNRRSTVNDPTTPGDDTLEVLVYEGNEPELRTFRVGESVKISLATESWRYNQKKSKIMRTSTYSNNIHVLASIYSISYSKYLVRQSGAESIFAVTKSLSSYFFIIVSLVLNKLMR